MFQVMKQWNFKNKWYRLNSMVACADCCVFFLATPLGDRIQAASFLRFQASMAIDCHCLQAVVAIVLHQACVAEIFSSKSSWLFGFPRMAIRRLSRILYPGSTARLNKWQVKLKVSNGQWRCDWSCWQNHWHSGASRKCHAQVAK